VLGQRGDHPSRWTAITSIATKRGTTAPGIIVKEMMPNLMPYVPASFVNAVAAAILASVGLEALGLGPFDSPTIGMTIYWNIFYSSILLGLWWWLMPPIIAIILVFVGLFMVSAGMDEWANPRLRRRV
jgi:peptide/nickel transport system permease protein